MENTQGPDLQELSKEELAKIAREGLGRRMSALGPQDAVVDRKVPIMERAAGTVDFIIATLRGTFLIIGQYAFPEPQIEINGVHIHHYLFGIAILFLVAISAIHQKYSRKTLAILLGISLALIVDEFQYLVKLAEVTYPAQEIDTISFVGFSLLLSAIIEKYPLKIKFTPPKLSLIPKIAIGIAFWIIIFQFGIKPIKAEMAEHDITISRYIPHVHMYHKN